MGVLRMGILHVPNLQEGVSASLLQALRSAGVDVALLLESSVQDQRNLIADVLRRWCDEEEFDLVLTIGGTLIAAGSSVRESMPAATSDVVERDLPGIAEAMRAYAQQESELALLERGMAGVRGRSLILNLPYGAEAACLFLEAITDLVSPIMVHLQDLPDAPTLNAVLSKPNIADEEYREAEEPESGLRSADFAEYLRRSRNQQAGDG